MTREWILRQGVVNVPNEGVKYVRRQIVSPERTEGLSLSGGEVMDGDR